MVDYKTDDEIRIMSEGGKKLAEVYEKIRKITKPGITTLEIDNFAEKEIKKSGGEPAFKKVPGYRWSTCLCINDQVVHTPPTRRHVKEGDVLTVDIGIYFEGLNTDKADTFTVGKESDKVKSFLAAGRSALDKAITTAKENKRIGDISQMIQQEIEGRGYFVIRDLTGHGVGKKLHEDPSIPGYIDKPVEKTPLLKKGLTIAIEVIYAENKTDIVYEKGDNWSLITEDGSIAACFEETVAIVSNKTLILTR